MAKRRGASESVDDAAQRAHAKHGQVGIHGLNLAPDRLLQLLRRGRGANVNRHGIQPHLRRGKEDVRDKGRIQPVTAASPDDADDAAPRLVGSKEEAHLFANGIFVGPETFGRGLIDDDDGLALLVVAVGEDAALQHRHSQKLKETGGRDSALRRRRFSGAGGASLNLEAGGINRPAKGVLPPPMPTSFTPGSALSRRSTSLRKTFRFSWVGYGVFFGSLGTGSQTRAVTRLSELKAGLNLQHLPEAAQQESSANHQHQ